MKFIINKYNNSTEYYVIVTKDRKKVLHKMDSIYRSSITLTEIGDDVVHCFTHNAIKFKDKDIAKRQAECYCSGKKRINIDDLEILLIKENTDIEIE